MKFINNRLLNKNLWYEKVVTPNIKYIDLSNTNNNFSEVKLVNFESKNQNIKAGNEELNSETETQEQVEFSFYYYLQDVLNNYSENKHISTFCKFGENSFTIGGRYIISNKGFVDLWNKDQKIGEINNKYLKNAVRTLYYIQNEDKLFIGTDDTIQIVDPHGNLLRHKYVNHPADCVFFSDYGFATLTNSIGLLTFYDNDMNIKKTIDTECVKFHFIVNSSYCNNYIYVVCRTVIKIFNLKNLEQKVINRYTNSNIKSVTGIKDKRIFIETDNHIEIYDLESTAFAVVERRSSGDGIYNIGNRLIKISEDEKEIDECLSLRIKGAKESLSIQNLFQQINKKIDSLGMKKENLFGILEEEKNIQELELTTNVTLPEDYKYYLLNCQFTFSKCYIEGTWFMLNVKSVIKKYKFMNVIHVSRLNKIKNDLQVEPTIKKNIWNNKWIPIATNLSGDFILIDMDPNDSNMFGQILLYKKDVGPVRVEDISFLNWIKKFRDDLNSGMYSFNEKTRELIYKM